MSLANELVEAVSAWPEVEAITLGGSRATGDNDEKSDYDVYVYVTAPVSAERRLTGNLPSYDAQIRKAASRGDKIAVNHRMAAFMESYFDVLFALNRRTHPGEKRLDKLAERDCAILPKDFRKYIDTLFDSMYADQAVFSETLGEIVDDLRQTADANL